MTTANREDWLSAAVNELRPIFDAVEKPLPANVRVACGFPLSARRTGALGECWADTASADKTFEILINPKLAAPADVFAVLVHELCHSTAGAMNHGVNFQKVAGLMNLEPSSCPKGWKATGPSPSFLSAFGSIIDSLGPYPHGALSMSERKVQTTRMLKAVCPSCGYTVRLTAKWAALGLPSCPVDSDILNLS
jgi:hypothetical protein